MGKFTVIPQNAFNGLQLDAGVLLKTFDPSNPVAPADSDIICATTGGINPICKATYSDFGEDVDNVPNNMMEFKHLDGWECSIATTSLGTTPELIKMALGCADIDADNESKIVPRMDLKQTDFADIWWVGDRADGGLVAIQLKNALSTEGFSLQTTKNGKGQIAITISGHVSITAQKEVPMVFYSMGAEEDTSHKIEQVLSHVTSSITDTKVDDNTALEGTITANSNYSIASVVITMGGEDITATAYTEGTGAIEIEHVTGDVMIVATATQGA